MSKLDIATLQQWIGRREVRSDIISPFTVAALSATLDYPVPRAEPGEPLPALWHWLYFLATPAASELDSDGHPRRGAFLPPVPLPRRMWAGSDIQFFEDILVGDTVDRVSIVEAVEHKQGRSGELVFVTLRHELCRDGRTLLSERQRLVYREADTAGKGDATADGAPAKAQWSREFRPDPVLLFRYSALMFNSHRIHYDRDYAMAEEGYGGLVVQGPLTATLLLELLQREVPAVVVKTFRFRGLKPLLDGETVTLQGRRHGAGVELWALDASGALAMTASATSPPPVPLSGAD